MVSTEEASTFMMCHDLNCFQEQGVTAGGQIGDTKYYKNFIWAFKLATVKSPQIDKLLS